MPRAKTARTIPAEPVLDQSKIDGAMQLMRVDGAAERVSHDTGIFDLGRQVGAIQMVHLQRDFSAAAEIKLFEEIKKSNKFKDLEILLPDGGSATAENFNDFCRLVFGSSYSVMAEGSQNLRILGDSCFEAANRLGLNRKQLRLIRSLPEDQREVVQQAIQAGGKAEVVALVEDLAAQLVEATEAIVEAKAEVESKEQLLADKSKRIDQLKATQKRISKATPDEVLAELQKEATSLMNDALGCIRGNLRHALIALQNHSEDNGVFMAGLVGQVQADISALRDEFNLPDVSLAADAALAGEVQQWGATHKAANA